LDFGLTAFRFQFYAEVHMAEQDQIPVGGSGQPEITPEVLKSALKAFKKRLRLTSLDDDSRLGKGAFSSGHTGVFAIKPPNQFPPQVWVELCKQGRLKDSGHGLYELRRDTKEQNC
jgi:hypothetical protein